MVCYSPFKTEKNTELFLFFEKKTQPLVIPCQICMKILDPFKMLFLSLIIIIRSSVMHFSQIWPPKLP